MSHDDFAFEPVRGLPAELPPGERMLWQGAPRWQDLAIHAFHVRLVALYFVGIVLVAGAAEALSGGTVTDILRPALWLVPLGSVAVGLLAGLAWASARTTVYTVTTKRVVLRFGIALPITLNLPFARIDGASVRLLPGGVGDIPLTLSGQDRLAYLILWPHVRPFRFTRPEPMLRAVPDAATVAGVLGAALSGKPVAAVPDPRTSVRFASGVVTA